MKLWDRIVTLTVNPAIDVTIQTDTLGHEMLNRVLSEQEEAGGKGVNVSRLLTKLGVENRAVVLCGEENFQRYRQLLGDQVALRPVLCRGKIRENLTLTSQDGIRIKLDRPGSTGLGEDWPSLLQVLEEELAGSQAPLLFLCGSLPKGVGAGQVLELLRELRRRYPVSVALDTLAFSREELTELAPVFFKPNTYELTRLFGGTGEEDWQTRLEWGKALVSQGVETLLVSLGEEGLWGIRKGSWLRVPGLGVAVRSTVAAGDSVMAGYAAALSWGKSWEEAVCFAAACGTAAVTHPGSGTGSPQEILSYFSQLTEMAGL